MTLINLHMSTRRKADWEGRQRSFYFNKFALDFKFSHRLFNTQLDRWQKLIYGSSLGQISFH